MSARRSASNETNGLFVTGETGRALGSSQLNVAELFTTKANAVSVGLSALKSAAAFATDVKAAMRVGHLVGSTPEVCATRRVMVAAGSGRTAVLRSTGVTTFAVAPVAAY